MADHLLLVYTQKHPKAVIRVLSNTSKCKYSLDEV